MRAHFSFQLSIYISILISFTSCSESTTIRVEAEPKSDSNVSGTITFSEIDEVVVMKATFSGLTPGLHAIHLHELADCSSADGKSTDYSAKHIIIATGARSRELPNLPQDGKKVIGYRKAMTLPEQPKSMIVVGSGAIGVEFAYFYNHEDDSDHDLTASTLKLLPLYFINGSAMCLDFSESATDPKVVCSDTAEPDVFPAADNFLDFLLHLEII